MKIVEGRVYLTKDGERVGPVVWDANIGVWRRGTDYKTGDYWHKNGSRYGHCDDGMDLAVEAD